MQSKAATVDAYLAELPAERRDAIRAVRAVIRKNLDKGYEEGMQYGMIGYYVPHRVFPAGYHCDPRVPLPFAGLASQKNYMSIYLACVYGDTAVAASFRQRWAATGKRLDMGKSCIRFKSVDDIPLDVIGETIRGIPAAAYIKYYESGLRSAGKPSSTKKAAPKKVARGATGKKAGSGASGVKPAARAKGRR